MNDLFNSQGQSFFYRLRDLLRFGTIFGVLGLALSFLLFFLGKKITHANEKTKLNKKRIIAEAYVPRLRSKDFPKTDIEKPLNNEEFSFLETHIWKLVSQQVQNSGELGNRLSRNLIFGYLYGVVDGYLQNYENCSHDDQQSLFRKLISKCVREAHIKKINEKTLLKLISSKDSDFVEGVFIGGVDALYWHSDKTFEPCGLDDFIKQNPDKIVKLPPEHARQLGKTVGTVIRSSKKHVQKAQSIAKEHLPEYQICPICDEKIKLKAQKCKHCGEWLRGKKDD